MDHDTNTCILRQWPASARGVIQARPGTISGGRGGGGGGVAVRFRSDPIGKVEALSLFGIGPTLFKYVITG